MNSGDVSRLEMKAIGTRILRELITSSYMYTAFCRAIPSGGESTRAAECKANRYAHIAVIRKSQSAALAYVTTNACQHRARQLCAKCFLELLSGTVLSVLPFGKSSTHLTCQELLRIRLPRFHALRQNYMF